MILSFPHWKIQLIHGTPLVKPNNGDTAVNAPVNAPVDTSVNMPYSRQYTISIVLPKISAGPLGRPSEGHLR